MSQKYGNNFIACFCNKINNFFPLTAVDRRNCLSKKTKINVMSALGDAYIVWLTTHHLSVLRGNNLGKYEKRTPPTSDFLRSLLKNERVCKEYKWMTGVKNGGKMNQLVSLAWMSPIIVPLSPWQKWINCELNELCSEIWT